MLNDYAAVETSVFYAFAPFSLCVMLFLTAYSYVLRKRLMLVVLVHVHVKPDSVDAFIKATLDNASSSVKEPGIARFDVIRQADDPTRFTLIEVYRDADAPAKHKETAHYLRWRDAAANMMAEPRSSVKYSSVFPDDQGW
jgi:quinol monooxygenase YgiN